MPSDPTNEVRSHACGSLEDLVDPGRDAAVHEVADTDEVVEPGVLLRSGPERSPVIVVRTVPQQTSASPSLA